MIPHIIHFTVPARMSAAQQKAIDLARAKHPGWEIKVWQDPVDPSGHRLRHYWSKATSGAQLADLIRLDIIYNHGGIYLDSDLQVVKSLENIADNCDFFICSEDGTRATNAVFGAARGHPAVGALIDELLESPPVWSKLPPFTTGPVFFSKVLKWRNDITVLPRVTFYPYSWNEKRRAALPTSYAVHDWAASWWQGKHLQRARLKLLEAHPRLLIKHTVSYIRSRIQKNEYAIRLLSPKLEGFNATGDLVRRTVHGHSLALSGTDVSITPEIFIHGFYELREELFIKRILKGGDFFVDVGANVGVFSLLAASRVGSFGRVYAYEPNPRVADLLRRSAVMNWVHERMVIRPVAVGAKAARAHLLASPACLGGASLETAREQGEAVDRTREYTGQVQALEVEIVSLDEEFPLDIHIRALKIDAEGFEPEVLAGATRLLKAGCIDFVVLEAVREIAGKNWQPLMQSLHWLGASGYEPYVFSGNGAIAKTTLEEIYGGRERARNIVMKRNGTDV